VIGLERRGEHVTRVDPEPGEQFRVRLRDPDRGAPQSVPVGILTDGDEDLPYGVFDPFEVNGLLDGTAARPAIDQSSSQIVQLAVALAELVGLDDVVRLRTGARVDLGGVLG
jgi:hypothetical protein